MCNLTIYSIVYEFNRLMARAAAYVKLLLSEILISRFLCKIFRNFLTIKNSVTLLPNFHVWVWCPFFLFLFLWGVRVSLTHQR